ncbi:MAG: hypothetical protein OCC45_13060 [Desulfotalea sp.]
MKNLKKIALTTVLITGLTGAGFAIAKNSGGHHGDGQGRYYNGQHSQMNTERREAMQQLRADNPQLFKDLAVKKSAFNAVMRNDNPNAKQASELAGELFELKEKLNAKKDAAGLTRFGMNGMRGGKNMSNMQLDANTIDKLSKFKTDNAKARKNIAMKQVKKTALLKGQNPDPNKIAALTAVIYDHQQALQAKAKTAGLPTNLACPVNGGVNRGGMNGSGMNGGGMNGNGMSRGGMNGGGMNGIDCPRNGKGW